MEEKIPLNPKLQEKLLDTVSNSDMKAIIRFEITRQGKLEGGTFWVIIDGKNTKLSEKIHPVDIIFRAERLIFDALLEGRTSIGDGLISKRMSFSGDLMKFILFKKSMESLYLGGY